MLVTNNFDVIIGEPINVHDAFIQFQCRKRKRVSADLLSSLVEVIHVQMRISEGMNECSRLKSTHLSHHVCQQRIGGNVEWNAEEDISASLVQLTIQLAIGDMELEEGMTRHQCHLIEFTNVPS